MPSLDPQCPGLPPLELMSLELLAVVPLLPLSDCEQTKVRGLCPQDRSISRQSAGHVTL